MGVITDSTVEKWRVAEHDSELGRMDGGRTVVRGVGRKRVCDHQGL